MRTIISGAVRPQAGDLVLARVDDIGKQRRIERPDGRKALLFVGDEIIVCYGNRYAPDQFEALIGDDLGPCDLVAAGGIAAHELTRHEKMIEPTRISPIGLIGDTAGKPLNLENYAIPKTRNKRPIKVVVVAGTTMNAGKTYASASLVRGLKSTGRRVAAIKVTGTGSGGDLWIMRDVGADVVLDFTDVGYASTYKAPVEDLAQSSLRLMDYAAARGCDYAIIEVADGLGQKETAGLLRSAAFLQRISGVVFAANDALGAKSGTDALAKMGHRILAISGLLTRSPLALRETRQITDYPVYKPSDLQIGALAEKIIGEPGRWENFLPPSAAGAVQRFEPAPATGANVAVNGHSAEPFASKAGRCSGLTSGHRAFRLKQKSEGNLGTAATGEIFRHFLDFVAGSLMEVEISGLCGAEPGRCCRHRVNYLNGHRDLQWKTIAGVITLKAPRLKKGKYVPSFLKRGARTDRALIAALGEYWDHGNTVYWRDRFARAVADTGISITSSELNRLRTEVTEWVQFIKLERDAAQNPDLSLRLVEAAYGEDRFADIDQECSEADQESFDTHRYDKIAS